MINNGEDSRVIRLKPVSVVVLALSALWTSLIYAQTDRYFPESTKGFVSITNLKDFVDKLDKTSIGDLRRNPEAKEFFESFIKNLKMRIQVKSKVSLGLTLDELKGIVDGEVAIGLIHPKDEVLGVITLAQFKDKDLVDKALAKVNANLLKAVDPKKKVTVVQKIKEGDHTITHYEFPDPYGIAGPPQVFYGRTDKYIVSYSGPVLSGTKKEDHVAQVKSLLKALNGEKMKSLADSENYQKTMSKLMAGDKYKNHQSKWFIESFGFIDAAQKMWPDQFNNVPYGSFRKVGFDAIKAAGGIGLITPGKREFLIRGFVYAPPVDPKNRFLKAAKMLDFTADQNRLQAVPVWVDKTASSYLAVHGRMLKAFNSSEPLFDELYGEGTMERIIDNFKNNKKYKANFDLRDELAANLGDRVIAMRDPKFPANVKNKRFVVAIDIAANANGVKAGSEKDRRAQVYKVLEGYMANEDPNLIERIKHKVGDKEITIFKRSTPAPEDGEDPGELELDDLDLDDLEDEPEPEVGAAGGADGGLPKLLEYVCFAQFKGQVFVSPDLEFMKEILDRSGKNKEATIQEELWFKDVNAELDKVKNSTFESLRYALRLDLPYKIAFELVKESKGDLPIEKMIKKMLGEEEETRLFDLKKIPKDFDRTIGAYLGYFGWSMTTEEDGWLLNGIVVRKGDSPTKAE